MLKDLRCPECYQVSLIRAGVQSYWKKATDGNGRVKAQKPSYRCRTCGRTTVNPLPLLWTCSVCNHQWSSKDSQKPLRCAKCKTPYWDKPKEPTP